MSFDLMVFINKTDANTQSKWLEKLEKVGIECMFPDDYTVSAGIKEEVKVKCKLNPPLVSEPTRFKAYELDLCITDLNQEEIAEMIDSSDDIELN